MTIPHLVELDTRGLVCPMPLLQAKRALNAMAPGQRLPGAEINRPGSVRDFQGVRRTIRPYFCLPVTKSTASTGTFAENLTIP